MVQATAPTATNVILYLITLMGTLTINNSSIDDLLHLSASSIEGYPAVAGFRISENLAWGKFFNMSIELVIVD